MATVLWPLLLPITYVDAYTGFLFGVYVGIHGPPLVGAVAAMLGLILAVLFAHLVAYMMWVYRAAQNARSLAGPELKLSPRWAVLWYFIPIANLLKPYQAVGNIWRVGQAPRQWRHQSLPKLFGIWWAICAVTLLADIATFAVDYETYAVETLFSIDALLALMQVVEIFLTVKVVRRITRLLNAQHHTHVFE